MTLGWWTFPTWGSHQVACCFTYNSCECNGCDKHRSNRITITTLTRPKFLTLCGHSFLQWGSDSAVYCFAYKGCQCNNYAKKRFNHVTITILTKPNVVDARFTLILRMVQWLCRFLVFQWMLSIQPLCYIAMKSFHTYHTYKIKNHWRSVDAHFAIGVSAICNQLILYYLLFILFWLPCQRFHWLSFWLLHCPLIMQINISFKIYFAVPTKCG